MTGAGEMRPAVPGLARGLGIMRLFRRSRPTITPPEMARELGIPRSTVHRIVMTLEELGFLRRVDGSGAYALGPAVLTIGFEYLGSLDIVQLSNPVLARLHEDTEGSTHLAILNGTDIVYLSRHASRAAITSNVSVGTSLPAHATTLGRVLLADLSPADIRKLYGRKALERFTAQTPTTLPALEALLAEDRRRGYVIGRSYFEPGVTSIAAPIRDHGDRTVAAISVTLIDAGSDARLIYDEIRKRICAAAAAISNMLGAANHAKEPPAALANAELRQATGWKANV